MNDTHNGELSRSSTSNRAGSALHHPEPSWGSGRDVHPRNTLIYIIIHPRSSKVLDLDWMVEAILARKIDIFRYIMIHSKFPSARITRAPPKKIGALPHRTVKVSGVIECSIECSSTSFQARFSVTKALHCQSWSMTDRCSVGASGIPLASQVLGLFGISSPERVFPVLSSAHLATPASVVG